MKAAIRLKQGLAKVRRDRQAGRFDQALATVGELLRDWPDQPRLLVLRAELIQLQEDEKAPGLDEAKADLQRAVELDEESPTALIELGRFLSAVEDDAGSAAKCFDKAASLCVRLLKDALLAQAEVLAELDRREEALACLAQAYWLQAHSGKPGRGPNGSEILEQLERLPRPE